MPRRKRLGMGGFIFHVMNRGARRGTLFVESGEYDEFVRLLRLAVRTRPIRLLNFCVMPNHFHLLAWPRTDTELPRFMHWLTATHAKAWREATKTVGQGVVYQGRYKAIPVQTEGHFLRVARYVERNPVRAGLVESAADWTWSSAWHRDVVPDRFPLAKWPVPRPANWLEVLNTPQSAAELAAIRKCVNRGRAIGNASWRKEVAKMLEIPEAHRLSGFRGGNAS
jgi:Transposase and inactivated derivatives